MSSNIFWYPVKKQKKYLSTELKLALQKRYGQGIDITLKSEVIPYFEGLRDAGITDADTIIEAIEAHDQIGIKEEW